MKFLAPLALCLASALAEDNTYHRIGPPSSHLKVESCQDIDTDLFGDEPGSCESVGFTETCISCYRGAIFMVTPPHTASQLRSL
jgi:hypothetical protein